jgi:hypothetical protein
MSKSVAPLQTHELEGSSHKSPEEKKVKEWETCSS